MKGGKTAFFNGLAAEEIAERSYSEQGARLIETRWRCPEGEIDLILEQDGMLVFVEVKARRDRDGAARAIPAAQWRRLGAAAASYLATRADAPDCRFDVVLIDRTGQAERIENAWSFDEG